MSSKKRPTLFLIHGLRGSHHGFAGVEKYLAKRYEVINMDIPGSGGRAALDPHNLDSYVEYFHETISKLPEKPVVVAHSMGTILASHYVEKYPKDTLGKVVLMSPTFPGKAQRYTNRVLYGVLAGVLAPLPKKTKKKVLASKKVSYVISHYLTCDKSKQKWIDEEHYKYSGRFDSAKSLMADIKMSMSVPAIVPKGKEVLVVMGEKDKLFKAKVVREAAERGSAAYVEVEGSGHFINYERPEVVGKAIEEFLNN